MEPPLNDAALIVKYECFRGTLTTWDDLFADAAEFVAQISRERLIGISHSADKSQSVVTVWCWNEPGNADAWASAHGVEPRRPLIEA